MITHFSEKQSKILASHLDLEIGLAQKLSQLLDTEYQTLSTGNAEMLISISEQKQNLVTKIEQHNKQRSFIIAGSGYPNQADNIATLTSDLGDQHTVSLKWQKLLSLVTTIRQQNIINGGIIQVSLQRNRNALSILTGRDKNETDTYTAIGKHNDSKGEGISLARA
ncbi:MAG: flagella synthesis protein FlgN [bacterium]